MEELIKKYQYIIDIIIHKYIPSKSNDEDYKQIGLIALWNAIELYDEKSNIKFETFASVIIRNKLISEFYKETRQKNFLNILDNVISIDKPIISNNGDLYNMYDYIKNDNDIEYIDLKEFVKNLNECEIQIIRLKQKKKTDTEIKNILSIGRKNFEKNIKSAKEKLKNNIL